MVTHLEWSDSIGKRVRSGDWADQAISTAVKIEDELRAGGNDLGLAGGRRENAAQLVDYYMEEAKVVYVVYRVWTAGFQDWLLEQGVAQADLDAELDAARDASSPSRTGRRSSASRAGRRSASGPAAWRTASAATTCRSRPPSTSSTASRRTGASSTTGWPT